MEVQSGLLELSVILWVSAFEGCLLGGVPLYVTYNVREQKICERGVNHENHENIMPRKFGAILYTLVHTYLITH